MADHQALEEMKEKGCQLSCIQRPLLV